MEYPDKAKIRQSFVNEILGKKIGLNDVQILDSKAAIDELTKNEFRAQKEKWNEFQKSKDNEFRAELEQEYLGEQTLSAKQRDAVWDFAWREGHSGGYGDVRNKYIDLVDFAIILLTQ